MITYCTVLFLPLRNDERGMAGTTRLGRVRVFLTFTSYIVRLNGRVRGRVTRPLEPAGTLALP